MYYSYSCSECGYRTIDDYFTGIGKYHPRMRCSLCGSRLTRECSNPSIYRGMHMGFESHYNNTVGAPVSSMREFNELLRKRSDEQTEATGMSHQYSAIDPRDQDAFGVTDESRQTIEAVNHGGVHLEEYSRDKNTAADNPARWGEPEPLIGEKT